MALDVRTGGSGELTWVGPIFVAYYFSVVALAKIGFNVWAAILIPLCRANHVE